MSGPTQLNGIESLSKYSYMEILEQNVIAFFDWGFLNADGFINVRIPQSGAYGGDFSRLRPVNDVRYSNGRVWEAARANFVWESGVNTSTRPISVSGIFVGSTFRPINDGTYYIDYPKGRVVFNTGVPLNSVVRLEHSSKYINVTSSNNVPWLRISQNNSFRVDNEDFLFGSGAYLTYGDTRLQLPAIAIEITSGKKQGFQIGGGSYNRNRVNLFVLAEDKNTVDRIAETLDSQREKTIYLFDSNKMATDNKFPLNQFGSPNSGFLTYPSMVQYSGDGGYRLTRGVLWGKLSFIDSEVQDRQQLMENLYQRPVVLTTESVLTNI